MNSEEFSKMPSTTRAKELEYVIGSLEGWAFGRWLQFTTIDGELSISLKAGWVRSDGIRNVPNLKAFSDNLNAAMLPVIRQYALDLRQELANECAHVSAKALGDQPSTIVERPLPSQDRAK